MTREYTRIKMQKSPLIRVLFIDDNKDIGDLFHLFLEARGGFKVYPFISAEEGLSFLTGNTVDIIISDYAMPEMDGISFLKEVKGQYPDLPFIMLTGEDSKQTAIDALNAGADFYQNKGDDLDIQIMDLAHKITVLVSQKESEKAIRRKDAILEAISYAADQFLKGNIVHIDSREILGRLGTATEADQVCLYNVNISKETRERTYDNPVIWSKDKQSCELPPSRWPDRWHTHLLHNFFFISDRLNIPAEECDLLDSVHIDSVLILPIYANTLMCGYLVFEDREYKLHRTDIEIQTIRMAAEIIGSARYRRHIEEFYKCPVEEAILGVFLLCGDEFRYVNPKICSIFGYRRDELLCINPYHLVRADDQEIFRQQVHLMREEHNPAHHLECVAVRKDGSEIFVEMYLTPIKCQGSQCIAGNLIDVTDRRKIQLSLQESEQRYRRLAEQLDDLILVIDRSWQVSYINPAATQAFNQPDYLGEIDLRNVLVGKTFSKLQSLIEESMNDGSIKTLTMDFILPEQGTTWYDISITPLRVDEEQITSIVIYFHDVSYRIQHEEEIRRTGLAQLELNMEQFQILNDEIRNPLQVIKGLNHLQGGEFTSQIENQLTIINGLIDKLDRAWVQSEKVHKFLLRHYEHGLFIDKEEYPI